MPGSRSYLRQVHFNEYLSKADDYDALGYRNEINSDDMASFDKYTWEEYLDYRTEQENDDFIPFGEDGGTFPFN